MTSEHGDGEPMRYRAGWGCWAHKASVGAQRTSDGIARLSVRRVRSARPGKAECPQEESVEGAIREPAGEPCRDRGVAADGVRVRGRLASIASATAAGATPSLSNCRDCLFAAATSVS